MNVSNDIAKNKSPLENEESTPPPEECWDDDNYGTYNPLPHVMDNIIIRTPPSKKSKSEKKKFRKEERLRLKNLENQERLGLKNLEK